MFTTSPDSSITVELIKEAIKYNETRRSRYNDLEAYYMGRHDKILEREDGGFGSNNKIVVNHAKYITDINTGYLLGNPVEYQIMSKNGGNGKLVDQNIDVVLDEYKKQTISDLDHEIAKDCSIFGKQYELSYIVNKQVFSKDIDVRNCVIIYDDTVDHKKMFGIIYQKNAKDADKFDAIVVYDKTWVYQYATSRGEIALVDFKPHFFSSVPIVEYRNNVEEMGDFEQVTSLIDAYNLLQSDRVNDKEQIVQAIVAIFGSTLTTDQLAQIKRDRFMAGLKVDSRVEYLGKPLAEADVDILRKVLENDIHKISMTPNLSDENFVGNSSGVAIRYKLLAFEQSVSNKERMFEKGLKERFGLYQEYLAKISKMTPVQIWDVDVIFKRNLPQNDFETSQMINNLNGLVDRETLIAQLSFVRDASETIELAGQELVEKMNAESKAYGTGEANGSEENQNNQDQLNNGNKQ